MNKIRIIVLGIFLLSQPVQTVDLENQKTEHPKAHTVRVLIDELVQKKGDSEQHSWTITSNAGFILYDPQQTERKWQYEKDTLHIQQKHTDLYVNSNQCLYTNLRLIPKDGYAHINGEPYHGTFSIIKKDDRHQLINHVDLEEYVYAVLRTESWPGWPVEVNKVFAIISRSYVMSMIDQTKSNSLPYHVKNTNAHQTYRGMHTNPTIRAAIEQTRGLFLIHDSKPALAMFDSCCGGIIPAQVANFDFDKVPYLARTYACTHCARCNIYSWNAEVALTDLQKQLSHVWDSPELQTVGITKKDNAGLVQEIQLKNNNTSQTITGKQLYKALKDVKSFCFTMQTEGETVKLTGKGFGHHLGLCQWGAREMVRDGWNYKRILSFYYPGTQLVRLQ